MLLFNGSVNQLRRRTNVFVFVLVVGIALGIGLASDHYERKAEREARARKAADTPVVGDLPAAGYGLIAASLEMEAMLDDIRTGRYKFDEEVSD